MLLSLPDRYCHHLHIINNLQPTVAFTSYWMFAAERHSIFEKRLRGEEPPWTDNLILQEFKFTNTFRVLDRVSQYLLKEIIYKPGLPTEREEIVFRILLFKLFNTIAAWEVLVKAFGTLTWEGFNEKAYAKALGDAWKGGKGKGVEIWSRAYVQNQNYRTDLKTKHERYVALLKYMMDDRVADRLQGPRTYEQAFNVLRNYPLHRKGFISMQHLVDLNYSTVLNYDEDDFIMPGEGAIRGIRKCFGLSKVSIPEAQSIIYHLVHEQELFFEKVGLKPVTLFGQRRLHAIDIQNCFCEVDKYSRVAHPELKLKKEEDGVEKIKQTFEITGPLPAPFFPPKWDIRI